MINRIKYVLNNEYGGPNLESLLAIAISLAMVCAARVFATGKGSALDNYGAGGERGSIYEWLKEIQKSEGRMLSTKTI